MVKPDGTEAAIRPMETAMKKLPAWALSSLSFSIRFGSTIPSMALR